jgi:hypothetical protein
VHVGKCIGKIRVPCSPVSRGLYVKGSAAVFCRAGYVLSSRVRRSVLACPELVRAGMQACETFLPDFDA